MAIIDNLLAYYDFDTDESPIQDIHGAFDLAITGYTFDNGDGIINSSYLSDSNTDVLKNGTLLDDTDTAISVSFWFKHIDTFDSGKAADEWIFDKRNVSGEERMWVRLLSADGTMQVFGEAGNDGGKFADTTQNSWTGGTWYHVVVTWGGVNGLTTYINGSEDGNDDTATTVMGDGTLHPFRIGNNTGDALGLNDANVDEFGVWDKELTQAEVTSLYNGGAGLAYPFTEGPDFTKLQINIGDAWKLGAGMKINIGDDWKEVEGLQINIGDTWKEIF